ncbi:hypothetical protein [Nonlabens ulvanivorans]|uniref:hypothetical protein n=1 Tax=Nonlabens ulvanivorans TaxID=906888 RepID=UPI002941DA15|nr:hypothetical protein [Nonlabens ulvanivorans]WOI22744.1 hypothetical protein R1T42_13860 [Nonlabens ulvanivorans]
MIKSLIVYTLLSMLIFFSISFFTLFNDIHSPLSDIDLSQEFTIGFPFTYYYEFRLDKHSIPNAGWNLKNLLLDCCSTWLTVVFMAFLIKKYFKK